MELVEYENVRQIWDVVRPGVVHIMEMGGGALDWHAGDVLADLMRRNSRLVVMFRDGVYHGFLVLRHFQKEFTRQNYLFVWLMYAKAPLSRSERQEVRNYLLQAAKRIKAVSIEFESPRRGWPRLFPELKGQHMTIYQFKMR